MSSRLALMSLLVVAACGPAPSETPPATTPVGVVDVPTPPPPVEPSEPVIAEAPDVEVERKRTESGLSWEVLATGTGAQHPTPNDSVKVHYTGWKLDGTKFDSSRDRGSPATFGVSKVIQGWTEVLQLMVKGDRWRVTIPAELAYGDNPKRAGAPAGVLVFEIELLDVIAAPPVPDDVAGPPPHAVVTPSGLAYVVLKTGTGKMTPTSSDHVEVHYTGWQTDGKMFDSSVTRGKRAKFGVSQVIPGWTEMLQLMVVGDRVRVWIPAQLGYGATPRRPGAPAGMLVFDIELFDIKP